MLKAGDRAPLFTLQDQEGRQVSLSDLRGRKVWLWFFTSAGGKGWTVHAHGYRENYAEFARKGIALYGVNDGGAEAARAWIERENLPFPVLLDPDRSVATAYGIARPDAEKYVANNAEGRRPAVLIDEEGTVIDVLPDLRTVEQQLEALARL